MTIGSIHFVYHIDGDGANLVASTDMLNFANGFELQEGGWTQQVPAGDNTTLIETLNFYVRAYSQDDLADRLQMLDEWITRVAYYKSKTMRTAVWLRVTVTGETQPRQALITAMQYSISDSAYGVMWADNKFVGTLTIVLERSAFWEEISPVSDTLTTDNYLSDTLAALTSGDAPARVWRLEFNALPAAANHQNTAYYGFKNDRYFDPSLFFPVRALNGYEAGAGTDATFSNDATTFGGRPMTVSFATATLVQRHFLPMRFVTTFDGVNITIETLTNDYIRGQYLCLMRAKVGAFTSVRARIKTGYDTSSTGDKIFPRRMITSPTYHLYEMGVIEIPNDRSSAFSTSLYTSIKLEAERLSGSGGLIVDCYILIPRDASVKMYTAAGFIQGAGAANRLGLFETNPLFESYAYTLIDSPLEIFDVATISPFGWVNPLSESTPNVLVGAIDADATASLPTTSWSGVISYFRRWRTLRGNE